ncbi:GTPase [Candidatus Chloroploca sp. M-50]|uniref:GTPase n=1 Tax=Candidatus Chloroploca mongolica TaxID=2528176 RepID=A0ABS4D7W4_9CHLR|nr:GTPase [Candidatus Chloroploca mongolica]MBP1465500.1 GTPase [Candidatus Chloroploca mongolica]
MSSLFPREALASLRTDGAAERWVAVQTLLHPVLAALAEQIAAVAAQRYPRFWPLYEVSFKSQRYLHRGRGRRDAISDYWVAFDRPPRGAGVLLAVSGREEAILIGLQLWRVRKPDLARVWETGRAVWLPLVERVAHEGQARFAPHHAEVGVPGADGEPAPLWLERYLASRRANYLWAGFVYPWATMPDDLAQRLTDDVLALVLLNEAVMEQAETHAPTGALRVREMRQPYLPQGLPPIEVIAERVRQDGFALDDVTLRAYHIALQTRPLVILPGISGTGKTRLTRRYADAVYGLGDGQSNPYYLLVAVQPDWHNARDLLGYYNALTGQYHATPFLRFLLQAAADPQQFYYVCLDELNLARPEYYLAPILSAMETVEGLFDLGVPVDEVALVGGGVVRNPVRLPTNLRLIGTVNVDESTFALSDKVLDRANVIELTEVDLDRFRATYPAPLDDQLWALLVAVQRILTDAGQPVGYRTLAAMLQFITQASGTLSVQQAFDLQLKQKILPRLRGEDSPRLRRALTELLSFCLGLETAQWGRANRISPAQLAAALYPASASKLQRMLERLDQDGFTDFYS